MEMLHPSTHEFWDTEELRTKFMDYLAVWSKNSAANLKQGFHCKDSTTTAENFVDDEENIEVGFVDGLFEMFRLREEIKTARSEIIAESVISSYTHKFGSVLLETHLAIVYH